MPPCRPMRPVRLVLVGWAVAAAAAAQPSLGAAEADALVRAVFTAQDAARYEAAAEAYLGLLAGLDRGDAAGDAAVLRALDALWPVVPAGVRAEWGLERPPTDARLAALPSGVGPAIVRWWRGQDDLPATPANERLHEHLARVTFAQSAFASDARPRGFDARGDVYVRLGPPGERVEVTLAPSVAAFDLDVPREWTRLPANEVWTYRHVRRGLHFVFVRPSRRRPFRQASSEALLPRPLRAGAPRRTAALLRVMEEVYGQLALRDPAYGAVLDEVALSIARTPPGRAPAPGVALDLLAHVRAEDSAIEAAQSALAPLAHSLTRDGTDPLPAAVRWARFRDPDGSTRVVVQWGVADGRRLRASRRQRRRLQRAGLETGDSVWVSLSVARVGLDQRVADVRHVHVPLGTPGPGPVTESVEVGAPDAPTRLALQWQARLADADGRPGPRVRLDTDRIEAVGPLPESGFAVSDLLAFARTAGAARPHPFPTFPAEGLAVSFEVYGLSRDADGRARVRVEVGLRGPDGRTRSTSGSSYETDEAVLRELIELDGPQTGPGTVVVRVTDEVSGAAAERTLAFAGA